MGATGPARRRSLSRPPSIRRNFPLPAATAVGSPGDTLVRSTPLAVLLSVAILVPPTLTAQVTPPGWLWRTDAPATPRRGGSEPLRPDQFEFSLMAPGWHITQGPGAILYDGGESAQGRFVVEGELILFPDASDEEYGVFVGGTDLTGDGQGWLAFVVRGDGQAAVIRSVAGERSMMMGWTTHAAVKTRVSGGTVKNFVAVRAEPDSVRFVVNGERVASWPRAAMAVDGAFGFRIGKGVNLHITNLDITRRFAPFPRR
jgi:hypothetical protein